MGNLTSIQVVLNTTDLKDDTHRQMFVGGAVVLILPRKDWLDMGRPTQLTVSIVGGDTLNA